MATRSFETPTRFSCCQVSNCYGLAQDRDRAEISQVSTQPSAGNVKEFVHGNAQLAAAPRTGHFLPHIVIDKCILELSLQ
jgi:hypothetical protein